MKQLLTEWANHDLSFSEYPRPLKRRKSFINLNGFWQYSIRSQDDISNVQWMGNIRVPFSIESYLSTVQKQLLPDQYLIYRKEFINPVQDTSRLILHFDAVDQDCKVYINKKCVIKHNGGYIPFEKDITPYLEENNEIIVVVQDDTDASFHSRGKQTLNPKGMFYTSTSGIWKSVWMEIVPEKAIYDIQCHVDYDLKKVTFDIDRMDTESYSLEIYEPFIDSQSHLNAEDCKKEDLNTDVLEYENKKIIYSIQTHQNHLEIEFETIQSWTCQTPYLYYFKVKNIEDEIVSYFAFRLFNTEIHNNQMRICLNHKPYFQRGVLDQGYWPDGGLTPPSDKALMYDILKMKELGFNMLRKHIKVEFERFYYHCDRLGMIVWQDMVCGGSKLKIWFLAYVTTFLNRFNLTMSDTHSWLLSRMDQKGKDEFEKEMEETMNLLKNHPCIAVWVLFNEGWGQFETKRLTDKMRMIDSSRIIDSTSGWYDQKCGDLKSHHHYYFKRNLVFE